MRPGIRRGVCPPQPVILEVKLVIRVGPDSDQVMIEGKKSFGRVHPRLFFAGNVDQKNVARHHILCERVYRNDLASTDDEAPILCGALDLPPD